MKRLIIIALIALGALCAQQVVALPDPPANPCPGCGGFPSEDPMPKYSGEIPDFVAAGVRTQLSIVTEAGQWF